MSMSRRLAVLGTALGTVAAGLFSGAPMSMGSTTEAGSAPPAAGQSVHVLIKPDHTVVMPGSIRPGFTTFDITSRRAASFQILRPAPGYTAGEATRDANAAFTRNNMRALRRFEANTTLLGGISSRPDRPARMSVRLPKGSYWAIDVSPRLLDPAKAAGFEVSGQFVGGRHSGHIIRAVDSTTWGKVTPRIPTRGRIWFQNLSTENHFIVLAKLAKGKTMADFRRWVQQAKQGRQVPPPLAMTSGLDSGVVSPNRSMSFNYRVSPGNYVLMCFWPDADMGGMPHVLMGMYRGLRVG